VRRGSRLVVLAVALVALLLLPSATSARHGPIADLQAGPAGDATVFAAASLTDVFQKIAPRAKYSFAGSNTLALQIRNGAPADVFASAAPNFTQDLFRAGLVERPQALVYNKLALIVPKANPAGIRNVFSLRRDGTKLVVAAPQVPVGSYTRQILRNLGLTSVLRNVVSQEPDVRSVATKVALGEADAGFVYVTDAKAYEERVNVISLPAWAQPKVRYEIAVVSASRNKPAARAFVRRVLGPIGRGLLSQAGFFLS
jgi:molybdate transport system substrate-binding protein